MKNGKKLLSKLTALTLALLMSFSLVPITAAAAAAPAITVKLTVNDKGDLAKAKDGSPMAWKEVTVKDADANGNITFSEALTAAHESFNSADGYSVSGGYVVKLWGTDTYNTLFFLNGNSFLTLVDETPIADGDFLTASVNKDDKYYADWYATFDKNLLETEVGKQVTLTVKGHLGMANTDEQKVNVPLPDITVSDANGEKLGKTDADGKVTFTPDKAGKLIVTATGIVKDQEVEDWSSGAPVVTKTDCPIIAPACIITVKETPAPAPTKKPLAKGKTLASGKNKFKVTSSSAKSPTVSYLKPKKKTLKTATVPATVKYKGITYKVTSIANNAFKNNKKLKKVTIGANIKTIGKAAFAGDKNLKKIIVKSKVLKKVGKNALKGINKKAVIKVQKKFKKKYTKLFKKKGQAKTVKVK